MDDYVIESLESDNLALQNLYTGKYVQVVRMLYVIGILQCFNSALAVQSCSASSKPLCFLQGNPKFLEAVSSWQKKLGTVDLALSVWNDVQRKWQALESIFVGSADIRVQLPEDSKRFDAINAEYLVRT